MRPANSEFLEWLDDEGNIRADAPEWAKKDFKAWQQQQEELDKLHLQAVYGDEGL